MRCICRSVIDLFPFPAADDQPGVAQRPEMVGYRGAGHIQHGGNVDYFIIGYDILRKVIKGILNRQVFDENFLMAVATIGAMALAIYESGEYLEAIAVMLFYQVEEWFQGYAVGKSRRNISALMDIRPDYANVEREGRLGRLTRMKSGKQN